MKIKSLHLRNIASIEKADIDFENEIKDAVTGNPASIFLISGDTGAGKSVILDGIAMALYKKTPRIVGVVNKTNNEYTNNDGESISINSIEQYTRLGISDKDECYSELVFEGNDGKVYHARLELGIAKSNRNTQGISVLKHRQPKWEVKTEGEDWQKVDSRSGQPILNAVGLTFDQFGRMAMLAQGQFASFLTGDKVERESILEQLTNTAKFSYYGKAISNLYANAKTGKENAQTAHDTEKGHTLSPEELEELQKKLEELNNSYNHLDDELKTKTNTLRIVNDINTYNEEILKAEKEKTTYTNIKNGEEYQSHKSLVTDWDNTNQVRQSLRQKSTAEADKTDALQKLNDARKTYNALFADLLSRQEAIQSKLNEKEEIAKWLQDRQALDVVYSKADAIVLQLKQYKETCNELSSKGKERDEKVNNTPTLANKEKTLQNNFDEELQEAEKMQRTINDLTEKRNKLDPTKTNEEIIAKNQRKNDIEKLKQDRGKLKEKQEAENNNKLTIAEESKQLKNLQKDYEDAQRTFEEKEKRKNEVNALLSTMKMSVDQTLTELRQRLQKEHADTCPLCGQPIQHLLLDKDFAPILTPLQQREEQAQAEFDDATNKRDTARSQYDTFKGSLEQKQKNSERSVREIEEESNRLEDEAQKLGLDTSVSLDKQISDAVKIIEGEIILLKRKQKEAEDLQKDIFGWNEKKKTTDERLNGIKINLSKAQQDVQQNRKDINRLDQEIGDLQKKKAELSKTLSDMLAVAYPSWSDEMDIVKNKLKNDAKEYLDKKKNEEKYKGEIEKDQELLNIIINVNDSILANHPDWKTNAVPQPYTSSNIHKEWTDLQTAIGTQEYSNKNAADTIAEADRILNEYYVSTGKTEDSLKALIKAESEVADARNFIKQIDEELKSRNDAIEGYRQKINSSRNELQTELRENMPTKESLEEAIGSLSREKEQNINDKGIYSGKLNENNENLERLNQASKTLENAKALFEKWDRINKVFGGTRFRTLVQTYILRPLLNNANIYLEKITDRYTLTCSEDNDQLSILVLDRYNKNQVRSVTVLSGGERFMISLALSLALSSLNRQDMNVNILFIDEGFGTLDETNLNSVMSTLEKLQEIAGQTQRRVGIISHREELVERIPVKIQVKKKGEGRSLVEITNES